ncbi:hypothetical protein [Bacillus toyonensis]|uniref:hypothetical protein n=1 Tax=Bacillus toyonensis TaxID=155322 RepID=UPI00211D5B9F|nr:hypothetical protein [Bacillus toyonensis]
MKTANCKKPDRLSVVRTKKQVSAIPVEFELRSLNYDEFDSVFIEGVEMFRFQGTHGHMEPKNFGSGQLLFTDSKFRNPQYFNFSELSKVQDFITGIGLTKNKLIVQVYDQHQERKLQLVYVAPSWLIQREKERMK